MDGTLLLIVAGLLGLGYAAWAAVRELGRVAPDAGPGRGAEGATAWPATEQASLEAALLELECNRELGRVDEEDGRRVAATLREPLARLEQELGRCGPPTERRRLVEEELARRVGRPAAAGTGQPAPGAPTGRVVASAPGGSCPGCQRPYRAQDRFCQGCGRPLAACPACAAPLPRDARFCKRCGQRVA